MDFECLLYEQRESVCYLTLNRPDRLNALNPRLMDELREVLDVIEVDSEIRVVILTGAGRTFSAGFDIGGEPGAPELHETQPGRPAGAPEGSHRHLPENLEPEQARHSRRERVRAGRGLRTGADLRHQDSLGAGNTWRTGDSRRTGATVADYALQCGLGARQGVAVDGRHHRRPRGSPVGNGQPGGCRTTT